MPPGDCSVHDTDMGDRMSWTPTGGTGHTGAMTVDLFAGPGGWDVAAADLGIPVEGIELDPDACATRLAAGLKTTEGSVLDHGPSEYPDAEGLIASPPCQTFSATGTGCGRRSLERVMEGTALMERGEAPRFTDDDDPRTRLVLEPLRWALEAAQDGRPFRWLAFEQVPTVLPVWRAMAPVLDRLGYGTATGILSAEQYGVPQTRRRAVLVARLGRTASLPTPTHSRYHSRSPERLDPVVDPWVAMSDVVLERAGWTQRSNYAGPQTATARTAAERGRSERGADLPSLTITSKVFRWTKGRSSEGATVEDMAALQSFPPDFLWQGNTGSRRQQVGNAVPPLLARAILAHVVE